MRVLSGSPSFRFSPGGPPPGSKTFGSTLIIEKVGGPILGQSKRHITPSGKENVWWQSDDRSEDE